MLYPAKQNYPLSWVEAGPNGTLVGRGVAFVLVDILRERFNFTFEVVVPENNFEIGGSKPEDSLIGLLNNSVSYTCNQIILVGT